MSRILNLLTDRMDELDDAIWSAEKSGDTKAQAAGLRARATAWRDYGALLREDGQEFVGAELSAQRDEVNAQRLEGGAQ